jgi:hypothetical protein
MTNYIDSFNEFSNESNLIDLDDLFCLNENGSGAKYSKEQFKEIFRGPLLESEGQVDDELLEKAHAYYEFSLLKESKSHWFNTKGKANYLDCETHVILIKDGEGYIIEKSTFDLAEDSGYLNEGLWDTITSGWNRLKAKAISVIKTTANLVKDGWKALSYGAKKAWEFVKTCANVVIEFAKGMTFVEWAALGLSVLSAILGLAGGTTATTGLLAAAAPFLTGMAGLCQGVAGILHVYEGYEKYKIATKILQKNPVINPTSKISAGIIQALPEYVVGGGMICLGVYDITKAATSIINPASGTESVAVGTTVKTSLQATVKTLAKGGHAIEHAIEHAAVSIIKKVGIDVVKETSKAAIGKIVTAVMSTVASSVLSEVLGFIWESILKIGQGVVKGFDYVIGIPGKITKTIDDFNKSADSTFTKILAKGLSKIVKPMTSSASNVISKYIQPIVDSVKKWFAETIKGYGESKELLKEYKHELHTGVSHAKKPGEKESHNRLAPKHKIDIDAVDKKDVKIIKKATKKSKGEEVKNKKKNKVKESKVWEMNYLRSFDDLEFI